MKVRDFRPQKGLGSHQSPEGSCPILPNSGSARTCCLMAPLRLCISCNSKLECVLNPSEQFDRGGRASPLLTVPEVLHLYCPYTLDMSLADLLPTRTWSTNHMCHPVAFSPLPHGHRGRRLQHSYTPALPQPQWLRVSSGRASSTILHVSTEVDQGLVWCPVMCCNFCTLRNFADMLNCACCGLCVKASTVVYADVIRRGISRGNHPEQE